MRWLKAEETGISRPACGQNQNRISSIFSVTKHCARKRGSLTEGERERQGADLSSSQFDPPCVRFARHPLSLGEQLNSNCLGRAGQRFDWHDRYLLFLSPRPDLPCPPCPILVPQRSGVGAASWRPSLQQRKRSRLGQTGAGCDEWERSRMLCVAWPLWFSPATLRH